MFTPDDRDRVRESILSRARADSRVVAAAIVGSLAVGDGDRWSDLDVSFGVADGHAASEVLDDFERGLNEEFGAAPLFDLPAAGALYRVFLLPGCLQLDLSAAPASAFGAIGPHFKLLFGAAVEKAPVPPLVPRELFGYGAHHAVRAWVCIERGRFWQAEYWISAARDHAMSLACARRGLPPRYGKGADDLPEDVRAALKAALVTSLDGDGLLRSLNGAVAVLLHEAGDVEPELVARVGPWLQGLVAPAA